MCGIVNFYHSNQPVDSAPQTIERKLTTIRHRGPDEVGYLFLSTYRETTFVHAERSPDYLGAIFFDSKIQDDEIIDWTFFRKLLTKIHMSSPSQISHRENHVFMFALALTLLREMKSRGPGQFDTRTISSILVKKINGDELARSGVFSGPIQIS